MSDLSEVRHILHLPVKPLRLPFDGSLSASETRMAEQGSFDYGPVPWA